MRRLARVPFLARIFFFVVLSLGIAASFLAVFPSLFSSQSSVAYASTDAIAGSFAPELEQDVPNNLHTFAQAATIEVLSAVICQLAGIDPMHPTQTCLGYNPQTQKLGVAPVDPEKPQQIGGVAGFMANGIAVLYTPAISSTDYVHYLADNFGIVKQAYAQPQPEGRNDITGFNGLLPILGLWGVTRDIAFSFLVLIFILIGVGVMLRVKIDPRTVMSIQNQIPRIIIALLLITFSYAIAGLMIDLMWASTYIGVNAITNNDYGNRIKFACGNKNDDNLSQPVGLAQHATSELVDTPIGFFNQVFKADNRMTTISDGEDEGDCGWTRRGIFNVTSSVANAIGAVLGSLFRDLFLTNRAEECFKFPLSISPAACIADALQILLDWTVRIIILIAILVSLFRVWFELLKAYTFTLLYVIAAPIWIVMGLLPGRPLGWENWLRSIFANLAVFPLTALLFVGARVIMDAYIYEGNNKPDPNHMFIPPLSGNPNMENFGTLIAFGMLLMAPTLLTMLRDKLKVPGNKQGAAIAGTLGSAAAIGTAAPKRQWAAWTARDQSGRPTGMISEMSDRTKRGLLLPIAKVPGVGKFAKSSLEKRDNKQTFGRWVRDENLSPEEQLHKQKTQQSSQATKQANAERAANKKEFGPEWEKPNDELPQHIKEQRENIDLWGSRFKMTDKQLPPERLQEKKERQENMKLIGRDVTNDKLSPEEKQAKQQQQPSQPQSGGQASANAAQIQPETTSPQTHTGEAQQLPTPPQSTTGEATAHEMRVQDLTVHATNVALHGAGGGEENKEKPTGRFTETVKEIGKTALASPDVKHTSAEHQVRELREVTEHLGEPQAHPASPVSHDTPHTEKPEAPHISIASSTPPPTIIVNQPQQHSQPEREHSEHSEKPHEDNPGKKDHS